MTLECASASQRILRRRYEPAANVQTVQTSSTGLGGFNISSFQRRGFRDRRDRVPSVRVNERIRAREVRVIDEDGAQIGVMPPQQALEIARGKGLDLVEIAPQAQPPVCRIINFGKYQYEQKKSSSTAASSTSRRRSRSRIRVSSSAALQAARSSALARSRRSAGVRTSRSIPRNRHMGCLRCAPPSEASRYKRDEAPDLAPLRGAIAQPAIRSGRACASAGCAPGLHERLVDVGAVRPGVRARISS